LFEEAWRQDHAQGLDGVALPCSIYPNNFGEGFFVGFAQSARGPCLFEEAWHQDHAQGLDGVALPCSIYPNNFGEGCAWVLHRIIFFRLQEDGSSH